jgi:NAD(P)-dependent dehydrogenase (short-subunit alcohol dehydrogenase family)
MAIKIEGTVALVTGANRGIGRALTEALIAGGAKKVYAGSRDAKAVQDLVKKHGARVVPLELDVTKPADVANAVARATDLQLLINNAGIATNVSASFTDQTLIEAARREIEVNVFGPFALSQGFAPVLARNGGGGIVNVLSVVSLVSFPILITYSASKAAAHSLTQATRSQLRAQGTYVAGVYAGPVDTDMAKGIPMEKASPESVAQAVLAGIQAGDEDIFPDATSREMGKAFFADPKALEHQVGQPAEAAAA